jgi:hypothetical protein
VIFDKPYHTTSLALTLEEREEAAKLERAALNAMRPRVLPELEQTVDIELLAVQRMLDFSRMKRLLNILPQEFGQLSQVERRLLLRAARGFEKRFGEVSTWMARNTAPEPELPANLKASA